jgi:hypothetical protein
MAVRAYEPAPKQARKTMRYMLLIHADEKLWATLSPEQASAAMAAYIAYGEALRAAHKYVDSHQLQPSASAKCVRVEGGHKGVSDGPFFDAKQALGGYYLIESADLAEAVEWAAKCPGASHGAVEVRPVVLR